MSIERQIGHIDHGEVGTMLYVCYGTSIRVVDLDGSADPGTRFVS